MSTEKPLAILGAGAWGTALAIHLARLGRPVRLWGRDSNAMLIMERERCNARYLPKIMFPESLKVCVNLASTINDVHDIMLVVPSHAIRELLRQIVLYAPITARIAWATKGLDAHEGPGKFIHEIVLHVIGANTPMAILSGPSFAKDVAQGLPTAVVLASNSAAFADDLALCFHSPSLRIYKSSDLLGVQICGAVKNIIAVAAGVADGLELGASARCALITRGLAEMSRLGRAMGANIETFMGLAGVGDLVLTCTSDLSRNRRFGLALAHSKSMNTAKESVGGVVESVYNASQVYYLATRCGIEMPVTEQVCRLLENQCTPLEAFNTLVNRDPSTESF